jgi:NTE family protein
VQTGRVRIFPREKITADAVMASACLPELFHAVEIDGVPYWDGYLGNPVIFRSLAPPRPKTCWSCRSIR